MLTTVSGGRVTPIGREPELTALLGFLEPHAPARALALYGGPGIGKTTLWEAGIAAARDRGCRVLPARAERRRRAARLRGRDRSPRRRRRRRTRAPGGSATAGARGRRPARRPGRSSARAPGDRARPPQRPAPLGRRPPAGDRDRRRPVARPALAGSAGVCRAAAGVARRPVPALATPRPCLPARACDRPPAGTSRPRPAQPRRDSATAARAAGAEPSAATSAAPGRLDHGQSTVRAGARPSLVERGLPAPGDELPVPDSIEDLLGMRVGRLAAPVRRVLLALALAPDLSVSQLSTIVDAGTVDDAVDAGVVVIDRDRARAAHPLLAAAAAEAVSSTRTPRAASRARRGGR